MKVAIVHDILSQLGGAERVLKAIHELFPEAPVFTIYCNRNAIPDDWKGWDIRESTLAKYLPFKKKFFRHYFPLYPIAIEQFDLREYDLVISSSYLFAKSVLTTQHTCHICYCHTPMRQAWDLYWDYKNTYSRWFYRFIYDIVFHYIRQYDFVSSARVDYYIANSNYVKNRIWKIYRRESEVIYPPIDWSSFWVSERVDDYYLCVSRLVPYKRIDIPIQAFNKLGKELIIVGDGPAMKMLKKIAKKNINFVGRVNENELKKYLSRTKALIYPSIEDFGIAVLEVQSSGRPAIVYAKGGAREGIIEKETGIVFNEPTPDSLIAAIKQIENLPFEPQKIRNHAQKFDISTFKKKLLNFINYKVEEFFSSMRNYT